MNQAEFHFAFGFSEEVNGNFDTCKTAMLLWQSKYGKHSGIAWV